MLERLRQGTSALFSHAQEKDRSQCNRAHTACDRAHLFVKSKSTIALFLRVLFLGLLQLGLNPRIFRVSMVSLDSINRLVNTEKDTCDFGEEFTALKEAIFRVYSFPFCFYFIL